MCVQQAISDASRWEELLGPDVAKAREQLDSWRTQAASEAKLTRALRDGASVTVLARTITVRAVLGLNEAVSTSLCMLRLHKLILQGQKIE